MNRTDDMVGNRYGKLVVLSEAEPAATKGRLHRKWKCVCDCGSIRIVFQCNLTSGKSNSCGCNRSKPGLANPSATHGLSNTPEYRIWTGMICRCENSNAAGYSHYGGRGITVCSRWRRSFLAFLSDMGTRPSDRHTIDRIDNEDSYSPHNCRWSTRRRQSNNRRNVHKITYLGHTHSFAEWGRILGVDYKVLWKRVVLRHWPVETALTTPVRTKQLLRAR
jgi:hypothetical protein